ncbi:hypothetical protein L208DRAFT_199722 [Tricholoma matsutake]|nr:hypothetical protein L208DRAFT_199722 [Tricholoma matsutake 945]
MRHSLYFTNVLSCPIPSLLLFTRPQSPGSPERSAKRPRVEDCEAPRTPRNQAASLKEYPRSPPSPNDKYIHSVTSISPSDTPKCVASEGLATNIRQLPFVDLTKFTKDPTIVHRFAHIICSWILGLPWPQRQFEQTSAD